MQKKIFFKNSRRLKLCGILSNPTNDKSAPIVIMCHGFATCKDSYTNKTLETMLNKKGIATFRFDFFGHGESAGKFEDITVSEGVDDTLSAISFIKKLGYKKIGLMGSSFGGICSTLAAIKLAKSKISNHDLFVLVLKSPVSDFMEVELQNIGKEHIVLWKKNNYIDYDKKRKLRLKYSFFLNLKKHKVYADASKIKIPTLIIHGDKDEIVPVSQSFKLVRLIPTSELVVIKGADHRYSKRQEFAAVMKLISDFVVKKAR
jgi:alpha/beta superfamily hydrolase